MNIENVVNCDRANTCVTVEHIGENDDCLALAGDGDLSFLSLNIRSLRNKLSLLEIFLNSLKNDDKIVGVVSLSETFLCKENESFYNINGYTSYHFSRDQRCGGGVSFLVREDLEVDSKIEKISCREVQFLIIRLVRFNMKLCGVYRPPTSNRSNLREFLDTFDEVLERNRNMISMGDFNINLLTPDSQELRDIVSSNNYATLNEIKLDSFTRRDVRSLSIIDHVHSDIANEMTMQISESGLSDHRFILLLIKNVGNDLQTKKKPTKKFTDYSKISQVLLSETQSINFNDFHSFHDYLSNLIQTHTVTKSFFFKSKKPWFDKDLMNLCKQKRKFDKLRYSFPNNSNFSSNYIELKKKFLKEVTKKKRKYFDTQYEKNSQNSREFWKITKEVLQNKYCLKTQKLISLSENGMIIENEQVADKFNDFFVNIGSSNLTSHNLNFEFKSRPTIINYLEKFEATTIDEVNAIISSLESNKAIGLDGISASFLKTNSKYLSRFITNFVNDSFLTGNFPDSLKFARVLPLFKCDDPKEINNYRPISVLPAISKIFEKLIKVRLMSFLATNKIIHKNQYGFLDKSNTTSATSSFINDVVKNLNEKKKTACIFIDIKKAFDCLNHSLLILKLRAIGIKGKALKVLEKYLENRKQVVVVNEHTSREKAVNSGAAQGSVLGPLLFLIYINDVLNLNINSVGRLFADDAAFVVQAETYEKLYDKMSNDLSKLNSFFESIHLEMSIKKTKFMIFRFRKNLNDNIFTQIHFDGKSIDIVDTFKYLGLTVDSTLSWKAHVDAIASKIAPIIGVFKRIRYLVDKKVLMQLYYSYVHSRLIYCLPIWAGCSLELRMRLQRLQNKAIKYINFKPWLTPTSELYNYELLSFEKLCKYESILLIHKIVTGQIRIDLVLLKNSQVISRNTRQSKNLRLPSFLSQKTQNSCFYRGILDYNELIKVVNILPNEKISETKKKIKRFLYPVI